MTKRYVSGKTRYIRYIIEIEEFNPLHFGYIKNYNRYIIVNKGCGCDARQSGSRVRSPHLACLGVGGRGSGISPNRPD